MLHQMKEAVEYFIPSTRKHEGMSSTVCRGHYSLSIFALKYKNVSYHLLDINVALLSAVLPSNQQT